MDKAFINQFDPEKPVVEEKGHWFDLGDALECECYILFGRHQFGPDKFSGDDGAGGPDPTHGYHQCTHCFRIEPL